MKRFLWLLFFATSPLIANDQEEWITILVHGTVGFAANISLQTVIQASKDCIDGSQYEANVLNIREHPYLFSLQPMQKCGLREVKETGNQLNASYVYGLLFEEMEKLCGIKRKNTFYTFGWSGLISLTRRLDEAREFYSELRDLLSELKKQKRTPKVRIIGYSHGATLTLNFADIRAKEFCKDTFIIDETYLVGIPVTTIATKQIKSPIFKQVYNIYSKSDKVQRLDIFSPGNFFSHRVFKGRFNNLTQIEMRFSAPLRNSKCYCLPANMRGTINQSPGHIELWFFGWTPSNYRKNLNMYPLPGSVFIPYLVCTAKKLNCSHVQVDIRPESEKAYIRSNNGEECDEAEFFTQTEYTQFINKAMDFHPSKKEYKDKFVAMQESIDISAYR